MVNTCFACRRRQAPVLQQKMASLPEDRITPCKPPFTYVGVDCFGPFTVRRGRSDVKRYGVLFTCLVVRAIHIEVVHSLDTESFINALRRFIARRGKPEEIRSDNGGNFVKGEKELREAVNAWNQQRIHESLLQRNIKWIFNPPASSHQGGVWERCIRTVRKVMKSLMREQVTDDEGLSTLMCEVESIVNGRPITKVSDDLRDLEALTPHHLLLLNPASSIPPGKFTKEDNYCTFNVVVDKFSTLLTCSGDVGYANIFHPYKRGKSGTRREETSRWTILSWSWMRRRPAAPGHLDVSWRCTPIAKMVWCDQ